MSKELFINSKDIRLLYLRYKDSSYYTIFLISLVLLVCFILFFQLALPQLQNWFSIRNEVIATRDRIAVINQNMNFINGLDKTVLDEQVTIATSALPFEKDFGGILNALTDASVKAGVSLDDYSFQLGNIASVSAQKGKKVNTFSSVQVTVAIGGDISNVSTFLKEVNTKLPLSEVTSVNGDSSTTTVKLQFYQKSFPKIVFTDDKPLEPLSAEQEDQLSEFESWLPAVGSQTTQVVSSDSAIPLF